MAFLAEGKTVNYQRTSAAASRRRLRVSNRVRFTFSSDVMLRDFLTSMYATFPIMHPFHDPSVKSLIRSKGIRNICKDGPMVKAVVYVYLSTCFRFSDVQSYTPFYKSSQINKVELKCKQLNKWRLYIADVFRRWLTILENIIARNNNESFESDKKLWLIAANSWIWGRMKMFSYVLREEELIYVKIISFSSFRIWSVKREID